VQAPAGHPANADLCESRLALGMKAAPKFLEPGDVVMLGIEKLGEQRQKVVTVKK
jgi:2-keto-4-pentenoate hydratase/2-oxohepta-3-ene-1,7-dioic acid hydratase in catechol pathway